jgi:hypothetical protein
VNRWITVGVPLAALVVAVAGITSAISLPDAVAHNASYLTALELAVVSAFRMMGRLVASNAFLWPVSVVLMGIFVWKLRGEIARTASVSSSMVIAGIASHSPLSDAQIAREMRTYAAQLASQLCFGDTIHSDEGTMLAADLAAFFITVHQCGIVAPERFINNPKALLLTLQYLRVMPPFLERGHRTEANNIAKNVREQMMELDS